MDELDPANSRYGAPSIALKGLRGRIYQGRPMGTGSVAGAATAKASPDPGAKGGGVALGLGKIDIENSALDYRNSGNALSTALQLGSLRGDLKNIDLDKIGF